MARLALRRVAAEDAADLARAHATAFERPWLAAAFARLLADRECFGWCAVPAQTGSVAGFVLARDIATESEILTLAVTPEMRRRRIGRRLVAAALAEAARRGGERMVLEVAVGNRVARALYAAFGFAEIGRRRAYYPSGGSRREDALVLARALHSTVDAGSTDFYNSPRD